MPFNCQRRGCAQPIPKDRLSRNAIYCSSDCQVASYRELDQEANPWVDIPSATVGALCELIAAADLIRRGYHVFRAMSQACECDLAAKIGDRLVRIEVKSAKRRRNGTIVFGRTRLDRSRFDVLAYVFRDSTVEYQPALSEFDLMLESSLPHKSLPEPTRGGYGSLGEEVTHTEPPDWRSKP